MNLLIYSYSWFPKIDGVTIRYKSIIDSLKNTHNITLIVPREDAEDYNGIEVIRIPGRKLPYFIFKDKHDVFFTDYLYFISTYKVIRDICVRKNIDLIHISLPDSFIFIAYLIRYYYNIPIVGFYHTDISEYVKLDFNNKVFTFLLTMLQKMFFFNYLDKFIVPTSSFKNKLLSQNIITENTSTWIMPIYINNNIFYKTDQNFIDKWKPNTTRLLYTGRITPEKSICRILESMDDTMSLCLIGIGCEIQNIKKIVKEKNLNVNIIGFVKNEYLAEWYSSADIFIMPSGSETMGWVTLEAMACETPIIAYEGGGTLDIITHNHNGLLFKDNFQLKQHIYTLKSNKNLKKKLISNGNLYLKNKSIKECVNELNKLYKGLT
jgi:sulfoquinovosyltransferase